MPPDPQVPLPPAHPSTTSAPRRRVGRGPTRRRAGTGLVLLSALAALTPRGVSAQPAEAAAPRNYVEQVEAWRARREAGLRRPTGWLSLVALVPLRPGTHPFGAAADNDIVFPVAAAPGDTAGGHDVPGVETGATAAARAHIGVLHVDSAGVEVDVAAHVPVTVVGDSTAAPVRGLRLRPDTATDGPSRLSLGSWTWWVIERGGDRYLRLTDTDSAVRRGFGGLRWYPVDRAWRLPARWVPPNSGRVVRVPTVLGTTSVEPSGGWLEFAIDGVAHRLEAPADDDGFFLIFADATSGVDTYGAGRFLWIEKPVAGDSLFVDFNRAYNPPCAFTPYATCPLPPPGNALPVAVTAGEQTYPEH